MRVQVRRIGDVGSALAHALYRNGHHVVMLDASATAHSRRGMAFTDATFESKSDRAAVIRHGPTAPVPQRVFGPGERLRGIAQGALDCSAGSP